MFGWLKRRLRREHQKLLWQNEAAATDPEMRTRLLFEGEHDLADRLRELAGRSARMFEAGVPQDGLTGRDMNAALDINKELRWIFEIAYHLGPTKFDPKYTPLGGWKFYLERCGEVSS